MSIIISNLYTLHATLQVKGMCTFGIRQMRNTEDSRLAKPLETALNERPSQHRCCSSCSWNIPPCDREIRGGKGWRLLGNRCLQIS